MTEPEDVEPFEARKAAHREQIARAGYQAEAIFAADEVVNARDVREAIARVGESALERRLKNPVERKVDHYRATLRLLDNVAATLPLVPVLRDELEPLAVERARRRGS